MSVNTYPLINGATSRGMMRRHYWHTQQLQARCLAITPTIGPNPRPNPSPTLAPAPTLAQP